MQHRRLVVAVAAVLAAAFATVEGAHYYQVHSNGTEAYFRQAVVPEHLAALNAEVKPLGWRVARGAVTTHTGFSGPTPLWERIPNGATRAFLAVTVRGVHGRDAGIEKHEHGFDYRDGRWRWGSCSRSAVALSECTCHGRGEPMVMGRSEGARYR